MAKKSSMHRNRVVGKVLIYALLILITAVMVVPFLWMLSASIKTNTEVFDITPFQFIPDEPQWSNYQEIWTKIPLARFIGNTVFLTIVVTTLQMLTSSFAAYAFAKLQFKHRNALFLAYIATIAMPWQVYMVPQFIMMRGMGLNDKLLAMICLQAFSAFGVFLMKQFYEGIPDSLCEAARIDGMSEYKIYSSIMLPLSKPALSTLIIFTFVNAYINAFYDSRTGLFCDSTVSAHSALHSNIYPLFFGLCPEESEGRIADFLVEKGLSCGVMTGYFYLKALAAAGRYEDEYRMLVNDSEHGWVNMLREGATACWEAWGKDQKWNTSLCHPWASGPIAVLIEDIAGIRPDPEVERGFRFEPHVPGELGSFRLTFPFGGRQYEVVKEKIDQKSDLSVRLCTKQDSVR